jgi:hypothetical protein
MIAVSRNITRGIIDISPLDRILAENRQYFDNEDYIGEDGHFIIVGVFNTEAEADQYAASIAGTGYLPRLYESYKKLQKTTGRIR